MERTIRNTGRWAMVGVLLSACSAWAFQSQDGVPHRKAVDAAADELSLYEEAQGLGIADAVRDSKLPLRQQRRVAVAIVREARVHSIDPLLVVAVIRTESAFNNYAVSPVGAMGLMQMMPATGLWMAERRGLLLKRSSNLFDSELNIVLGTAYLAELIRQFKGVEAALVAYNAGPAAARRILSDVQNRKKFLAGYPRKVLREHQRLERAAETRSGPDEVLTTPDARG